MFLSFDAIRAAPDLPAEVVEVPEWGGAVRVGTMRGDERDVLLYELFQIRKTRGDAAYFAEYNPRLLAYTLLKEDGAKLCAPGDWSGFTAKSGAVLDRIAKVAMRLNGLGEGAAEEAAKNSESAPSGASGSS